MRRNYILLPENIQRRPLPGHRHRPKKDEKVSETFTPVSRAGRRVPGEAKVKTANAKKAEERGDLKLFHFIKKLNRVLAARPTHPGGEETKVEATPKLTATNEQDASGSLASQLPQKRPMADSAKTSTSEVINVRLVKRARSDAVASSPRVKLEDMPRQPSIINSAEDTDNLVGNADPACAYDSVRQSFTEEHFHQHELVTATNTVQQHALFLERAVYDIVSPAFPDHPAKHQLANQPNVIFPEHEALNWPVQPFAPGFLLHNGFETRNDEDFELERVAVACAYAGMGEPMEIDPEFPTFIPNDTYADLNLERVAIACAYAGMDEPMDTTLDDTRGPVFDVVRQELQMFDQPGFAQYVPQQAQFELDVVVQPPMYQTGQHLQHQYFVDQDQRLRPPIQAYPIDQPFQQEHFVVNQMLPPHLSVQVNDYPVIEEYFPAVPPFDIGYGIHVQADVPIPLLPMIHDQPVDRQFELYHRIHEEVTNQRHVLPVVTEMVGHNETKYEDVGEAEQLAHRWPFLNGEAGEPDHARLFEDLFGTEDGDDDDDDDDDEGDDEEVEVII